MRSEVSWVDSLSIKVVEAFATRVKELGSMMVAQEDKSRDPQSGRARTIVP